MRRALIAFEPPDGGVAENVAQLAEGLRGWGWEVELAGPRESMIYDRAAAAGITVHRLDWAPGYGSPRRDLRAAHQLARCVRNRRFDLLHCLSAKAGVIGRLVASRARVPVVYSPQCFSFIGDFGILRRLVALTIERSLAVVTDQIICVSEDEHQQARRIGIPERRLSVVRNGSPPCPSDALPDPLTASFANGGPLVASVAVLREQKRIDVLIDAAPSILARVPEAKIAVIGDGPLREQLSDRAANLELDKEPRFTFLPFAGSSHNHLLTIDLFVLPSSWEGLPIALLEALACGVPTVATAVGGTPEVVVPETGLLVPPADPNALSDAIVALLRQPQQRAEMAAKARKRHADHFSVERMVTETAAVYNHILASRANQL